LPLEFVLKSTCDWSTKHTV